MNRHDLNFNLRPTSNFRNFCFPVIPSSSIFVFPWHGKRGFPAGKPRTGKKKHGKIDFPAFSPRENWFSRAAGKQARENAFSRGKMGFRYLSAETPDSGARAQWGDEPRNGRLPMARFIRARGLLSFIAARLLFAMIPGIIYFSPGPYMHMRNPIWGFYLNVCI